MARPSSPTMEQNTTALTHASSLCPLLVSGPLTSPEFFLASCFCHTSRQSPIPRTRCPDSLHSVLSFQFEKMHAKLKQIIEAKSIYSSLPTDTRCSSLHQRWFDDSRSRLGWCSFWRSALARKELVSKCFLWRDALFNIHVKTCAQQISQVIQFGYSRSASRDVARSVMDAGLHVAVDLLLLLYFANR